MKRRLGTLVTLGSFDGVHRGHQALIERTVLEARRRHLSPVAITFSVPPKMILHPTSPMSVLSTAEEKAVALRSYGIDKVVTLDFDKKLSQTNPFYFFKYVLLAEFRAKGIVVGLDFRFGIGRSAGALELVRWGQDFEFPVWVIPPVRRNRQIVSSSLIRQKINRGDFSKALDLLGRPFDIFGPIVKGRGVGRTLGFPTANVKYGKGKILPRGVFIVAGEAVDARNRPIAFGRRPQFMGVCNIGVRPTFLKRSGVTVEVHGLSGPFPARARRLRLHLLKRLRSEKKFPSPIQLKNAIRRDISRARSFFTARGGFSYNPATYQSMEKI